MKHRACVALLCLGVLSLGVMSGCRHGQPPSKTSAPPVIPVSKPVQRNVTEFVEYTGRTDAVESVGIRARVTGYLTKTAFREGGEVKKGELLFEIDPRPYQAQYDQAEGQVKLNEAQLSLARTVYNRAAPLVPKGAISQEELDQDKAAVDEAAARIKAAQAALEVYKLNLTFCKVTAPIDGQVSRYYLTPGNLVMQDQTLLTTIVSLDPMYAYFDLDEVTLHRVRKAINEGRIKVPSSGQVPVMMGLPGEDGYPHEGTVDFVNNVVNPSTGTIAIRGVFSNPLPKDGRRLLSPGMFVRIRLPLGQPHKALLVVDRALGSDQGLKFVYVVDDQHKIQYRRVTTGALQDDGLRVIEDGLHPDDWVVVGALQKVRPLMEVDPDPTTMPTLQNGSGPEQGDSGKPQPPPPGDTKKQ